MKNAFISVLILVLILVASYLMITSIGRALDIEYEYRAQIVEQHLKDVKTKEYKE